MLSHSPQFQRRILGLLLFLAVLGLYARAGGFEFVLFDDTEYVYENPNISGGLTWDGIRWVFTHSHGANWHPATGISHMIDCQLFGLNAGGHHLTSVFFHALNAVLLFLLLTNLTGAVGRSLLVAGLFAFHPLRVESVAWVSERKDVLSGLFWILTIAAYAVYAKRPGVGRYLATLFCFILGLMSKPMVVTLPAILLLLDFWPLGRWKGANGTVSASRLLLEKLPFFVCSFLASLTTIWMQGKAVATLSQVPFLLRIENALLSYWKYIGKSFLPVDLAFLYPYPSSISWWIAALAAIALIIVSVAVLRCARQRPWLAVGWFWYLITLTPVIGVIQVGRQSMADRYTYLPHIGLFLLIAWGLEEIFSRCRLPHRALVATEIVLLCALCGLTCNQLGVWRNSGELFSHALLVTEKNSLAHNNYGCILLNQGRRGEAISHFTRAIEYDPIYAEAHYNLGMALMLDGRLDEAIPSYAEGVRLNPKSAPWRNEYGLMLARLGKESEAIVQFREALQIDPEYAVAHNSLGAALANQANLKEAIEHFQKAIELQPDYSEAKENLNRALTNSPSAQSP